MIAGGRKSFFFEAVTTAPGDGSTAMHILAALAGLSEFSEVGHEGREEGGSGQENILGEECWRVGVRNERISFYSYMKFS